MKHLIYFYFIFVWTFFLQAQEYYSKEFGFISDNDVYVSVYLDEYYTNGLELFYKQANSTSFGNFSKKIKKIAIGQHIYNPFSSDVPNLYIQDRPYAGYAYINYLEQFINTKNIVSIGVNVGVTGKKTGAREAQNFIHQFYGIPASDGWNYQVKEKWGFGISAAYIANLYHKPTSKIQASFTSNLVLNTIISSFSSGIALKYNTKPIPTTGINNTLMLGTALQNSNEYWKKECYWGIKSYVTHQIKDHTITGDLHQNTLQKDFFTVPWVWYTDIGYYWNLRHWNISYHHVLHTKKTTTISKYWIRYGSIQISYKF